MQHKLSAAFGTKSLLEQLAPMNVLIWILYILKLSFKIRKNSWILGNFKIHKIRILNLCCGSRDVTVDDLEWA